MYISVSTSAKSEGHDNLPLGSKLDFLISDFQLSNSQVMIVQQDEKLRSYDDIERFPNKEE